MPKKSSTRGETEQWGSSGATITRTELHSEQIVTQSEIVKLLKRIVRTHTHALSAQATQVRYAGRETGKKAAAKFERHEDAFHEGVIALAERLGVKNLLGIVELPNESTGDVKK